MGAVRFAFELIDRFTGPAAAISKQLRVVDGALASNAKAMANLEGKTDKASAKSLKALQKQNVLLNKQKDQLLAGQVVAAKSLAGEVKMAEKVEATSAKVQEQASSFGKLAGMAGFAGSALLTLTATVGGLALAGGKQLLDAQRYRDATGAALKFQLGSAEEAQKTMGFLANIARVTGQDRREVTAQFSELVGSGLTTRESQMLVQLAADLKVASGGKDVGVGKLGDALLSLKRNEALSVEKSFAGLLAAGGQNKVYEALAKRLNIKSAGLDPVALKRLVDQRLSGANGGTGVRGQAAVNLFRDINMDVAGESAFGGLQKSFQATTVTGAIDLVQQRIKALFDDTDASPMAQRLLGILNQVATALDPTSESGKKLIATFDRIVGVATRVWDTMKPIVGAFSEGFGDGFSSALNDVLDFVDIIGAGSGASKDFSAALKTIGSALGTVIVGTGLLVGGVIWLVGAVVEAVTTLPGKMSEIGTNAINALVDGINSMKAKAIDAVAGLGDAVVGKLRALFQIRSPSRVMMQLGAYTSEGFALGIERGGAGVRSAAEAGLAGPVLQAEVKGGGRGGITIAAGAFPTSVTAADGMNEERLARLIADKQREMLTGVLLEMGAATT